MDRAEASKALTSLSVCGASSNLAGHTSVTNLTQSAIYVGRDYLYSLI